MKSLTRKIQDFEKARAGLIKDIQSVEIPLEERDSLPSSRAFSYGVSTREGKFRIEMDIDNSPRYKVTIYQKHKRKKTEVLVCPNLSQREARNFTIKADLFFNEKGY